MKLPLLALAICSASCGTGRVTEHFGLYVTGYAGLADVDTAWAAAAELAGVDASEYAHRTDITVNIEDKPIAISSTTQLYAGLSVNDTGYSVDRVYLRGDSVLDSETPLCHEFFHTILFLLTGAEDDNHTNVRWHCANLDVRDNEAFRECIEKE